MGSSQRVLLTVVICVFIIMAWSYLAPMLGLVQKPPPAPPPKQGVDAPKTPGATAKKTETKPASEGAAKKSAPGEVKPAEQEAGEGPRATNAEGIHTSMDTPTAVSIFTDRGAALRSWKLKDPRYQQETEGKLRPVDLVNTPEGKGPWPITTVFSDSDFSLPEDARFTLKDKDRTSLTYVWKSDKVEVTKKYTVDQERTLLWLSLKLRNLTGRKLNHRLELRLFNQEEPGQGTPSFTNPYPRIPTVLCHVNGEVNRRSATAVRGEGGGCTAGGCGMGEGVVNQTGEVLWLGSGDRYFLTAVVPTDEPVTRRCELNVLEENNIQGAMLYPKEELDPGKSRTWKFTVFVGAKELGGLDSVKGPPAAPEVNLHESLEFGWFTVICRPMLGLMQWFYKFVGNWGLSIILLTLVVKLLTLYWTQKSMRSMKNMQRLKPEMDKLKEKYGEDKQRLNQEMMNLYKAHNVNPLGGCLPMLIQMPVWFALYRTLGNAVELYRSPFVGWITDLTAPDPYYILPVAMGAAMYGQQLITPQPMEGTQAKMMKYVMPGMFTVMMLGLPSGLTLYIFVNTVLTIVHQYYMNKTDPHKGKPVEVDSAPAQMPGRAMHEKPSPTGGKKSRGPSGRAAKKTKKRKRKK